MKTITIDLSVTMVTKEDHLSTFVNYKDIVLAFKSILARIIPLSESKVTKKSPF